MTRPASTPFLTLGIIFLAIGMSGKANLRALGLVFLVIGMKFLDSPQ